MELKTRYRSTVLAVALAVGFWAGFHALQAYANVCYVIPAFLCGLILVALLEASKNIIAPILAHGTYNTTCFLLAYQSGAIPVNLPWFPMKLTSDDLLLLGLTALWISSILLPIFLRRK